MVKVMARTNSRLFILFLTLFLVASQASCGNQELMEKARQKVFLLNKQILEQSNRLPEGNTIEFTGRVKRTPDGKLQFTIDELKESTSDGDSKYLLQESLPAKQNTQSVSPPQGRKHEYIRYVLFEDMNDSRDPDPKQVNAKKASTFEGGGKALSQ